MAKRKYSKKAHRTAVKAIKKAPKGVVVVCFVLVLAILGGYFIYNKFFKPTKPVVGELSFHFMTLGNGNSGDSIYVKAGENDILIDAGSGESSIGTIQNYIDDYVTDGKLEYVIVTHADSDHVAGFARTDGSIFDLYECETIIDFPKTNKSATTGIGNVTQYGDYLNELQDEINAGATHYTALECFNQVNGAKRVYELANSISMEILYNYYYDHSSGDENNYSVCVQFTHGERKFLFTGDLEKAGEEKMVEYYASQGLNSPLSQVELFKAGHHGSKTSSTDDLLNVIKPKIVAITCAIGDGYDFPRQEPISRIAKYTDKVYVTTMANPAYTNGLNYVDMNGNIVVISDSEDGVSVICSNNNTLLKDTQWFIDNRTMPDEWKVPQVA